MKQDTERHGDMAQMEDQTQELKRLLEFRGMELENMAASFSGGVALYRLGDRVTPVWHSPGVPALTGHSEAEYQRMASENAMEMVFPGDRDRVMAAMYEVLDREEPLDIRFRKTRKAGGVTWVHMRGKVIGQQDGYPLLHAVLHDLNKDAAPYQTILDELSQAILVADWETQEVLYANRWALELAAQKGNPTGGDYVGRTCHMVIEGSQEICAFCHREKLQWDRFFEEERFDPKTQRYYTVQGKRVMWAGREAFVEYITDMTDRKHVQMLLEREKDELKRTIDSIPGGIGVYRWEDRRLTAVAYNRYLQELLGAPQGELYGPDGQDLFRRVHPEDHATLMQAVERVVAGNHRESVVIRLRNEATGGYLWIYVSGISVPQEDGTQIIYACYANINAQKQAEEELRRSEQRYELAVEDAELSVWEYEIDARRLYALKKDPTQLHLPDMMEHVPETLIAQGEICPESADAFREMFRRIDRGEPYASGEFWVRATDGSICCKRLRYSLLDSEEGMPRLAFGVGQDITQQKREAEKYDLYIREFSAVDPKLLGMIRLNLTRNTCGERHLNIEIPSELQKARTVDGYFRRLAKRIEDPQCRAAFQRTFRREELMDAYRRGETQRGCEHDCKMADDSVRWVNSQIKIVKNPESGDIEAILSAQDIQERVMEEKIVQYLTNREYDFVGVIRLTERTIQFCSIRQDAKDCSPTRSADYDEDVDFAVRATVVPEEIDWCLGNMSLEHIQAQLDVNGSYAFTFTQHTPDGQLLKKQLRYGYLDQRQGMILMVKTDVTALRRQEQAHMEQMKEALEGARRANQAKSEFLSQVSHDLRTPMNAILGMTALARDEVKNPETVTAYLEQIESSSKFLLGLLNDVLDMSKIESQAIRLNPEPYALPDFMEEMRSLIKPLCDQKNVRFSIDIQKVNCDCILIDKLRFKQIFANLLSNAVKFTPSGGEIQLRIEHMGQQGNRVHKRFTVQDSGIGMDEAFQQHMFEPFTQEGRQADPTVSEGTGLGLSIVKNLVELMGGTVCVESHIHQGTTVTVELEAEGCDHPTRAAGPARRPNRQLEGRRILLCEDHPLNTQIARRLLEKQGIQVDHAANGRLGAEAFAASPVGKYDAVLMDIRMPELDGLAATRVIRAMDRPDAATVPIIAMTANAYEEDVRKALEAGMNAHLAKPVEPERLYQTLSEQFLD